MRSMRRASVCTVVVVAFLCFPVCGAAQNSSNERTFPQSKASVEKALKTLQSSVAGRLPALEGFTISGDRPLDKYQRGYYQCKVQVISLPSRGSRVRVDAKITAWYADPVASRSGYQALPSNGRLEADLLDRLTAALGGNEVAGDVGAAASPVKSSASAVSEPALSAPMPRIPDAALRGSPAKSDSAASLKTETDAVEKHEQELEAEAKSLEEILQNQSHPTNLVAVKKTGTPLLQSPNADSKILFPATAGDEFEVLDINSNWVHVRISGLSRGWLRRSNVEMPDNLAGSKQNAETLAPNNAEEFRLSNEQLAPFPGDWEPLRGKIVKIVTVQKIGDNSKNSGPQAKLEFARALFKKQYAEFSTAADAPAGIVLIFDSDDGGMVAATMATLKMWAAGSLSDEAVLKQCFFDPPELLGRGSTALGSSH